MSLYVLYEGPTGYAIFKREASEEIGAADIELQKELQKSSAFASWVKLVAFAPFTTPENALEDCICVSEGLLSGFLSKFLKSTMVKKVSKEEGDSNWELGVSDPRLGNSIHDALGFKVVSNESITELARCIRLHAEKLLPDHQKGDIQRAQCGLGHAFSRNKVKFNVHRSDNMIIQASALLEHMDKGVNLLGMRVKEWYGWHFPELAKECPEPSKYCKLVLLMGQRGEMAEYDSTEMQASIAEVVEGDDALAGRIYEKAVCSMGGDLAEIDWENIRTFAERVDSLHQYRDSLQQYLVDKMMIVAPNLTTLIGQQIGAKLISKAGSLTNLAKSPASTIQILGAEKALFRALKKKKGNTPKYGLIFHSSYIQRAQKENRGKISRYLANKAAIACRIDCFMDAPPPVFGDKLKDQVEARLSFFEGGAKPQSNQAVMQEALEQYAKVLRKREKRAIRERAEAEAAAAEEGEEEVVTKKRRVEA
eukprot:TRINITY_DN1917_c0_g1_i1.p1 TRINITY_DN1917_c0_g1~~TRINITY_DN1917_c0_g1_i1.p1  ORF type:complete len:479 (+),score=211.95 TRINITY_DN1917_c0_g1_i1:58-1494(+)